jgi:hypothetical protein
MLELWVIYSDAGSQKVREQIKGRSPSVAFRLGEREVDVAWIIDKSRPYMDVTKICHHGRVPEYLVEPSGNQSAFRRMTPETTRHVWVRDDQAPP